MKTTDVALHSCEACDRQIPEHIALCIYCKSQRRKKGVCIMCGVAARKEKTRGQQSDYCEICQNKAIRLNEQYPIGVVNTLPQTTVPDPSPSLELFHRFSVKKATTLADVDPSASAQMTSLPKGATTASASPSVVTMPIPSPDKRRYVVALKGLADFRSIQQAINRAAPGDIVAVKPGIYHERLILEKCLELVGDGQVDEIAIGDYAVPCLWIKAKKAIVKVKGLSFRGMNDVQGAYRAAIVVTAGELQLDHCGVQASNDCLIVTGPKAKAAVSHCRIHDSFKAAGVVVSGSGTLVLKNCDIFQHEGASLRVFDGGKAIVQKCKFRDSRLGAGIDVSLGGHAEITECDVFQNAFDGIRVSKKGSVEIHRSTVIRNRRYGIRIGEGNAQIIDCHLQDNWSGTHTVHDGGKVVWEKVPIDDGNKSADAISSITTKPIAFSESPVDLIIESPTQPDSEAEMPSLPAAVSSRDDIAPPPTTDVDVQTPKLVLTEEVEPIEEQSVPSVVEPEPIVWIAEQVVVEVNKVEISAPQRFELNGGAAAEWIKRLLDSELFQERKRSGGRRNLLSDELIARLLNELMSRSGTMQTAALGLALERPEHSLRGLIASVKNIVNIDGVVVLDCDDSDTVKLNRERLFKQFSLD